MTLYPDAVASFLCVFTSLVKEIPSKLIKHIFTVHSQFSFFSAFDMWVISSHIRKTL